jgi:hypothetical protein
MSLLLQSKHKIGLKTEKLPEYSKRHLDPRYLEFLELVSHYSMMSAGSLDIGHQKVLPTERLDRVKGCRKTVRFGVCEEGHKFLRGSLCRDRNLDPIDSQGAARDTAQDGYDILSLRAKRFDGRRDRVWIGVLTVPRQVQKRITADEWKKFRNLGKEFLEGSFSMGGRYVLWYRIDFQPWHSNNPFKGWYCHLHFTLSSIAWDTLRGCHVRLNFYQADMKGNQGRNSILSSYWRSLLTKTYGSFDSPRINVWIQYREDRDAIEHWLRYCVRNPVVEVYKAVSRGLARYDQKSLRWIHYLLVELSDGAHRGHWYGIAFESIRGKYLAKLNIVLEKQALRRKKRRERSCPKCGSDMTWDRHVMTIGEAERAFPGIDVLCYGRIKLDEEGVRWWLK